MFLYHIKLPSYIFPHNSKVFLVESTCKAASQGNSFGSGDADIVDCIFPFIVALLASSYFFNTDNGKRKRFSEWRGLVNFMNISPRD